MDCPKKFKGYCKYHDVKIEDDDHVFIGDICEWKVVLNKAHLRKTYFDVSINTVINNKN